MSPSGFFGKLRERLSKTRGGFVERVKGVFRGRLRVDEDVFEQLEEILIEADLGVDTTMRVLDDMRKTAREQRLDSAESLYKVLEDELGQLLAQGDHGANFTADPKPHVTLITGVNGTGKTTTAGKLAAKLRAEGKSVLLGAADTFRAAAADQLAIWSERTGASLIRHKEGADPAAVAYDCIEAAIARNMDCVLIDTAGRLHTKINLMEELKKIQRVLKKRLPDAPHEVLLVLDATTGQNGLQQARVFTEALNVTGIVLTKLDGTAKGGIVIAIQRELSIPIKFIGVGEAVEDLQPFNPEEFVEALFE